jgi:Toprim domain
MIKSQPQDNISSIPIQGPSEEILARNRAKFRDFIDFLGGVICDESKGFRATCPACHRDTLHATPTPSRRVSVYCHYCGANAPRRVCVAAGFDIPAPDPNDVDHDQIKETWNYWRYHLWTEPLEGTVAQTYLLKRGIDISSFDAGTFRHLQCCARANYDKRIRRIPAMVGWSYSKYGGDTYKPATIHATYLRPDGSDKIPVLYPKKTYGPKSGAVIFFAPDAARASPQQYWWVVGEGIETVLSYMAIKRLQGERRVAGICALNGAGLQYLSLPKFVRRVIVAGDNDANGSGQKFSGVAYWRFAKEGRQARYALPERTGQDWNDVLKEVMS